MFRFDANYPISSPAVQFVVDQSIQAPIHPHVYSNGHICASILGTEVVPSSECIRRLCHSTEHVGVVQGKGTTTIDTFGLRLTTRRRYVAIQTQALAAVNLVVGRHASNTTMTRYKLRIL
ncbi:hypothetical protein J3R82DRAFT_1214 [Butyriboletus roseoflavus]|nr:hypothetical protein J3R82DRAFT_1214 [Butyriboletus roseoflavus]